MNLGFTDKGLEKQKSLIGEFIINFEDLSDWIRFIIIKIVLGKNLNNQQVNNIETLLTDLTFSPLKTKFDSLIKDNFDGYEDFIKACHKLSSKLDELLKIRNSIAHGSYRLGWKDFNGELSDESFSLRHSKSTKQGYQKRSQIISIDVLESLNTNLNKISSCYNYISMITYAIKQHNNIKLADQHIEQLNKKVDEIVKIKLPYLNILN